MLLAVVVVVLCDSMLGVLFFYVFKVTDACCDLLMFVLMFVVLRLLVLCLFLCFVLGG